MIRATIFRCLALVAVTAAVAAPPADAIPAFARKYRVSCSLCHDPAPRLTTFGEQFAANGFEFAVGEAVRDTLDTGDETLRLLRYIDLAFRLDAYASVVRPIGRDRTALDLQTPYNIKILSGGPIANKLSYYLYFFLSERGAVAGLEDAYIQATDIGGSGVSVIAGQFQVSDPLFKRELRLQYEDYQAYRVRVGAARADLTYDRGLFLTYSPWAGGDVAAMVVNGEGLDEAGSDRFYDRDHFKNVALRYSQDVGPVRLGAFFYHGRERADAQTDRILVWGPDATLAPLDRVEVNLQLLRREDSNPLLVAGGRSSRVDAGFAEVVAGPFGVDGKWYATALYNHVDAGQPLLALRVGEQTTGAGYARRYRTASAGIHYLAWRNVRLLAEAGWDIELDRPRLTAGLTAAW